MRSSRLLVLGLTQKPDANSQEDDTPVQENPGAESGGILGYVSNVFTTDNASAAVEDQLTASRCFVSCLPQLTVIQSHSPGYKSLNDGIRVLLVIWVNMVWLDTTGLRPEADSLSMIYNQTHAHCRRVLEHLFRAHPTEVLESVIECWDHDALLRSKDSDQSSTGVFGLVYFLIANAQSAVHMIYDCISVRISNTSEHMNASPPSSIASPASPSPSPSSSPPASALHPASASSSASRSLSASPHPSPSATLSLSPSL
ncbi:hypothetical protein EDD22DRAFT_961542 [Suillus occidentalis]|nr:hypothetical protein EDD22DRAFT_961542 [Suillus occidentalis]